MFHCCFNSIIHIWIEVSIYSISIGDYSSIALTRWTFVSTKIIHYVRNIVGLEKCHAVYSNFLLDYTSIAVISKCVCFNSINHSFNLWIEKFQFIVFPLETIFQYTNTLSICFNKILQEYCRPRNVMQYILIYYSSIAVISKCICFNSLSICFNKNRSLCQECYRG